MARQVACYSVSFGLAGCYLPDSISDPIVCNTRKEFAETIREYLRMYDLPAYLFQEVGIRRLWRLIRKFGSSTAHFNLNHGPNVLSFHGMTEEEANKEEA